ncbi:MAG TPA: hypothetical protein VGF56_13245 [Rhizomicrobium sp.]|jgi:hypothetical protein
MQLTDFDLMERGPRRFDTYANRTLVPSPLGDFTIEMLVDIGKTPTPEMLAAASRLLEKFSADKESLAQKVYRQYRAVCEASYGPGWLKGCGVPEGLSLPRLHEYLNSRTLTVDSALNISVYTSPAWDREHGLYFDLVDGEWRFGE